MNAERSAAGEPAPGSIPPAVRNLVLIGYRGCGKTSVGRQLAQRLGWTFVDTDERVEAAAGCSISRIFARDGEAAFRSLETGVLADVTAGIHQVLSVGGGAVLAAANRDTLRAMRVCVWLTAPPEELHRRMQGDPRNASTRPELTPVGGLDEVRALLNERGPLYAAVADHVVETAGRSVEQVAADVLALVSGRDTSSETP